MHIGIDLGGTNTAAAVVGDDGVITKRAAMPTDARDGVASIKKGLSDVCRMLAENEAAPTSIGIGVPGTVDSEAGTVTFAPNLPLGGYNIIDELQDEFRCPVLLGNDANCAALGEMAAGGAKGKRDIVFTTLGTGIGGGIILDGRLHTGVSGAAGELGHMVIIAGGRECGCGRKGCWERYASATGLNRTANEFMGTHKKSLLWELCRGQANRVDGKILFDAFSEGDTAAQLTVGQFVQHLAAGIANIVNMLEPELICVGGGLSSAWDLYSKQLRDAVEAEVFSHSPGQQRTKLVKAKLGNDAGIIGAAMLFQHNN